MNSLEKHALKVMVLWTFVGIGISYGINIALSLVFGDNIFPYNLILIIGVFLALGFLYQRRQFKKMGVKGSGNGFFGVMPGATEISYECKTCGTSYKGNKCPSCGSKGGHAIFGR